MEDFEKIDTILEKLNDKKISLQNMVKYIGKGNELIINCEKKIDSYDEKIESYEKIQNKDKLNNQNQSNSQDFNLEEKIEKLEKYKARLEEQIENEELVEKVINTYDKIAKLSQEIDSYINNTKLNIYQLIPQGKGNMICRRVNNEDESPSVSDEDDISEISNFEGDDEVMSSD